MFQNIGGRYVPPYYTYVYKFRNSLVKRATTNWRLQKCENP